MARWARSLAFLLAAWPAAAQPFEGYVGRLDASQLGEDWYLLTPSEMPSLPLEGAMVSVLDCEEDCPAPVKTDAAGWFTIPGLGRDSAHLHFEPLSCAENDPECEPLEPRGEVFENGGRTVLGAKWPAGIEDTILRYMPLVANTIYIRREGEIPGLPGAAGAAARWAVWLNGRHGWYPFPEYQTFVHELMHVYESQLRLACWHENQEIDGWILHESWLRAYEADRRMLDELGLPLREPDAYELDEYKRSRETLAWFAEDYFTPNDLIHEWRKDHPFPTFMTHDELEQYAPNRYAWFERLVFARYLDRKSWERAHPDSPEDWPGMCEPFPPSLGWALDRLPPLPGSSKAHGSTSITKGYLPEPPPTECSFSAFH